MPIDGRVESIAGGVASGWAWDSDEPERRVPVTASVEGVLVGEGRADAPAPGLAERGIGDGRYGFAIEVGPADVDAHELVVHAGEPPVELGPIPELRDELRAAAAEVPDPPELAATVDGRVESVADGLIVGWAWSSGHPDVRVRVRALVDGEPVAIGRADRHAPGLAEIGVGDGAHAFALALPDALADGRRHAVAVEAAGTELQFVADAIGRGEGPWAGTRFAPAPPGARPRRRPALAEEPEPSESPCSVVVAGRRGWLFGLTPGEVNRLTSGEPPDEAAAGAVVERLDETAAALHALGIRHVVALMPSKHAVHRGLVPEGLAPGDRTRIGAAVARLADDRQHLDVLDLLPALRHAARRAAVFHPRDDALTARGAFAAHRILVKHAGLAPLGLLPLPADDGLFGPPRAQPRSTLEGLPAMEITGDGLRPATLDPPGTVPEPDDVEAAALSALRMPAEAHLEIEGLAAPRVYLREDAVEAPRILMLGHPVMHGLTPWLAETTSRLVVLSTPIAPLAQIELEMPALVLHVIDERLLEDLASAEHVVERVADEPLDALVAPAAASPVVEDEGQRERARGEDAGA